MKTRHIAFFAILSIAELLLSPGFLLAGGTMPNAPRTANVMDGIDLQMLHHNEGNAGNIVRDGPSAILTVPTPYTTITAAIAAASNGDIIQIAAGTYTENVIVNKSVEIAGSGAATTIIVPQVSGPNPGGGSLPPGASNMMLVQANNVTIHDLTLDGDNPALTSGIVVGGADLDARNGIITNHLLGVYNNLTVYNVTVKNVYLRGIYASSGGTFNFHHNTVQNVQAEYASIAMFNFGGSGVFAYNTVSDANDAISANWSSGTQFLNNTITNSGSGVHTDNNGGVADLIQGNIVTNSMANGYGVWAFFPYVNTVINNNTVTNCDVGLFAWGGAGGTATFTNNTVNGQNRSSCIGIYTTPGADAWGSYQSNVSTSFSGNTVQDAPYGFVVETDEATPFYSNTLTSSSYTTSGVTTDVWVTGLGPISTTGLSGNTVLVTAPARVSDGVALANSGGIVNVGAGTFSVPSQLNLNKPNLTLKGAGSSSTILQVSGAGERFYITANGTTIRDMNIEKTDKTGVQNIIYVGANNITIRDNIIHGQFVIGDGDVSRAMVVAGGLTGLQIQGNTFYGLRQPAYLSGPTTGNIVNNYTYGTRGWVMEGGDMTFTGNTWGSGAQTNVYDIAVLSLAPPTAYADIVAISNANNGAVIEDQRVSPAVLSVVYVDASTSYSSDLGGRYHPYATIPPAITRVVAGGTINVAAGTYADNVVINKLLSMVGAGSSAGGSVITPSSGIGIAITASGASASNRLLLKNLRVSGATNGIDIDAVNASHITFENVASVSNTGHGINTNPPVGSANFADIVLTNCDLSSNGSTGFRFASYVGMNGLTITNGHMDGNVYGFQTYTGIGNPIITNVSVNGTTFNNNTSKGMYLENMDNATFANITVNNSGTAGSFAAGIDLNLKYHNFSNITFTNATITNSGAGDPTNGVGITVKGRNDGSYAPNPATLSGLTIAGGTFGTPSATLPAISIGNKVNTIAFSGGTAVSGTGVGVAVWTDPSSPDVDMGNTNFASSLGTFIAVLTNMNVTATSAIFSGALTNAEKEAKIYHRPDNPAVGIVNYGQYSGPQSEVWVNSSWAGTPVGNPVGGHWFGTDAFATIQAGVNAVVNPGVVHVQAGNYSESVNANKANVSILGDDASTTIINPGSGSLNCITISANGCTIAGLTLTGGQNGVSGTTASSKFKNLVVSGNSQNGIRLVDADFNIIQGNTITGHATGVGVLLAGAKQNTVSGNTIQNNNYNVQIDLNGARTARGNFIQGNNLLNPGTWSVNVNNEPTTTKVNFNVFNPADKYVRNSTASVTQKVDATYNWFGGEAAPLASHFSGAVDYSHNYATDPTVSVMPVSYYMPTGTTVTLSVMALLPAGTYVRGIDATLNWTNDMNIPDVGDPSEGSFFSSFPSRVFLFDRPTASSVRANSAILGPTSGAGNPTGTFPYVGTIFSQDFQAVTDGMSTLTLSGIQLRDPNNNPITPVTIDPPGGAQLIADGTPPSVTGVLIHNTSIDNDNFVKNTDNIIVTATVTDASALTVDDITADLSSFYGGTGHTADNPASYAGSVATWSVNGVTCNPSDGVITVTIGAADAAGNTGSGSDNITADNTPPTAPTAFVAKTVSPGGHQKVALSWTAGTDANYRGVVIRYNSWSYPTYPVGATPVYPATATGGTGVSTSPVIGTSTTHMVAPRNVLYYSVFAVDWAGNYSALDPSGTDRAANYYLGDLGSGTGTYIPGSGGYDGHVNFDDLFWFSRVYFTTAPGWTAIDPNAAEADFGPTAANKTYPAGNRFGIPRPDGRIDFEDLMIFSMNYYNVAPRIQPPDNRIISHELALGLEGNNRSVVAGDEMVVTLTLANDGRPVKGTSVSLKFDPQYLQVTGVEPGPLFGNSGQGFLAHKEEGGFVQIDQAVLGMDRTVDYSGNLAAVRFRAVQSGEARVTIENGTLRDGENSALTPALHNEVVDLPTTFALAQNYPNPFNPVTTIKYQVASPVHVELAIFNVIGEKVATLVNEVQEPGFYRVAWNANTVASGAYFYVLRAGEFTSIKRMMLVK